MTDLRKAAEQALDFMDWLCGDDNSDRSKYTALNLESFLLLARAELRQALAQPPCQTGSQCVGGKCPECEREWVGLTGEEVKYLISHFDWRASAEHFVFAIEAKLKEKNT